MSDPDVADLTRRDDETPIGSQILPIETTQRPDKQRLHQHHRHDRFTLRFMLRLILLFNVYSKGEIYTRYVHAHLGPLAHLKHKAWIGIDNRSNGLNKLKRLVE